MIKVTIKCFSQVKYALNQNELVLELKNGFRSSDLEKTIRSKAKGQLDNISLRVAINQQYVSKDTELKNGDEVAFIPPVQGG
jgi:molybdopterin synthase catalytic subunit